MVVDIVNDKDSSSNPLVQFDPDTGKKIMGIKEFQAFGARLSRSVMNAGMRGPADLAKSCGLNRVTVGAYMRGDRAASLEACVAMGRALGVSPTWLYSGVENDLDSIVRGSTRDPSHATYNDIQIAQKDQNVALTKNRNPSLFSNMNTGHTGVPITSRMIPLYSCALAGPDGSISIGPTMLEMIEAPAPISSVPDAYAVRVSGDSMEPRYFSGETVFVHPRMPVKKGDWILLQAGEKGSQETQGYIKRLVSIDDRRVVVEQLNPKKEITFPRERVVTVHKIVLAG